MLVYHGSSHNFRTLRLRPDLTSESTKTNEGVGVYFSLDRSVAESYGKFLYTIAVNDQCLVDMRRMDMCVKYVRKLSQDVYAKFGFRLEQFVDMRMVAEYLQDGGVAISGVGREVKNLLDSEEKFYRLYGRKSNTIFNWLEHWKGVPVAYLFTYQIRDCGVIRSPSPNVAVLVNKERLIRG